MAYPCQKAAASQSLLFMAVIPFFIRDGIYFLKNRLDWEIVLRFALIVVSAGAVTLLSSTAYDYVLEVHNKIKLENVSAQLSARSVAGMGLAGAAPAAIPSPHRVVMVHSDEASSWQGQRIDYWNMIDQTVVDAMVDRGLRGLTGAATQTQAWRTLIPNYQPHQKIAIKINNNNAGSMGSDWGNTRDDDIDAIIEPVNSIAKSLLQAFGSDISAEDIWVYESYRCFFDTTFMDRAESGIRFYSAVTSPPANVTPTGFSGTGSNSIITFRYNPSISLALNDVVVDADYLINMPIAKKHGSGSATLGFKNHYGSIQPDDGRYFSSIFHSDGRFLRTNNNLVDIGYNPHIRDKTVLIVGDAIIGSRGANYGPPVMWPTRFPSERTPEMLLFSVDPVAADSVMADLLLWENGSEDVGNTRNYMLEAMDIGLGVAEIGTWVGSSYPNVDIIYQNIDMVRINLPDEPPQTFYVPDDYSTIQAALDASFDGDTIIVRDGSYSGAGNKNLNFRGKAITLHSENGPANCIIDCQGDGTGFVFYSGESSFSIVQGFTITNGRTSYGGGIYCVSSSPTIVGCIISGNTAVYGGGICLSSSSATVTNCTITGNTADQGAGGIYCYDSDTIISYCTISDNSATSGGGIFCYTGSPTVVNCIMVNDSAAYGPELLLSGGASLGVGFCDIEGGQAMAYVEPGCTLNWGGRNLDEDPSFIGGGDYHLSGSSPCIDAGANIGIYTDIDGNLRPQNSGFDMGSDEYSGSCVYSITPDNALFSAGGGAGSVSVATQAGCVWIAASNDSWITITSGGIGMGDGSVDYWVSPNQVVAPRSGSMTIAGQTFSVDQAGDVPCTYSISPDSVSYKANGGTGSVSVTAAAGCYWVASSNDNWIVIISGDNGSGSGTVSYWVSSNQGVTPRSGSMTIAGETFTVDQAGGHCAYSIAPTSESMDGGGGTGSVSVTAPAGCDWTATSNDSWITITSGGSGSGDGVVICSVSPNLDISSRVGSATIAGEIFTVYQAGTAGLLTQIDLQYPPSESIMYFSPTFTWISDGGADVVFAVDFSFTYPMTAGWSTFEDMRLQIQTNSWAMPGSIWDRVPSGSYVYWKVRGTDLDQTPLTIIDSNEVCWFYKP